MGLTAVRRTITVLLVAAFAVAAGYTAWAASTGAPVGRERSGQDGENQGRPHRTELGPATKYVRNSDGTVTTVRG